MILNKRIWLEDISFILTGFLGFFAITLSLRFHNEERAQINSMITIMEKIQILTEQNATLLSLMAEDNVSEKIPIETMIKNSKSGSKRINEKIIKEYDNNIK